MMKIKFFILRIVIIVVLLFGFINICASENVKKSIDDNRDDNGEANDEAKDESMDIPVENDSNNMTCTRRQNSQLHEIREAQHKQFPFMGAVISQQNEYLCSGAIVSNGLVLTTAKCTTQPISYILINATKAIKDETTVMLHVIKTEKFPTYTGSENLKDVGLIYTEKHNNSIATKIKLSNFTSARNMADLEGIGFGLNSEMGQQKELQYIGMELRSSLEGDILKAYFDCVDTKVNTCFKDTGGPVIFDNELVGIVIIGQEDCTREMSSTYATNKRMADILPTYTFKAWLDEKIKKNEELDVNPLLTYPSKPNVSLRRFGHDLSKASSNHLDITSIFVFISCIIYTFY